jgi:hypothetical protein
MRNASCGILWTSPESDRLPARSTQKSCTGLVRIVRRTAPILSGWRASRETMRLKPSDSTRHRIAQWSKFEQRKCLIIGAPGEIRTPGLLVRSQALYPTELRAQRTIDNNISTIDQSKGRHLKCQSGYQPRDASLDPRYSPGLKTRPGRVRGANITTSIADHHSVATVSKAGPTKWERAFRERAKYGQRPPDLAQVSRSRVP